MGLKDLKSNLAAGELANSSAEDLTYGKGRAYDRPDQGFSMEPFIKGGINIGGTSTLNTITDGFIRGGALMHLERKAQDTVRFGKFLITPRGITWNLKQLGLQKSNPKISEPSVKGLLGSVADQRQWNFGINTLAQVIGQGTGLHIKREGLSPLDGSGYIDEEKFLKNYEGKPTWAGKSENTNRLLYLYDTNINTDPAQERFKTAMVNIAGVMTEVPFADRFSALFKTGEYEEKEDKKLSKLGKFAKNAGQKIKAAFTNPNEKLYSYNGGPGSTYGIGKTNIYKYTNTNPSETLRYYSETKNSDEGNGLFSVHNILFEGKFSHPQRPSEDDLDGLKIIEDNFALQGTRTIKEDFSSHISPKTTANWENQYKHGHITKVKNYLHTLGRIPVDNYNKKRSDFKSYHREERVNLGNPGGDPTAEGNTTVDLLNAMDVFRSGGDLNYNEIRDLIRFRIEAVNPTNPTESNVMVFRAFLDNLNDNFTANYNEFTYNGRGENFYTYNGFNRDISFSFKIAAQSSGEMKPLYRKLNYLVSNTAPEYHVTSNRMMTPFMRLTIGAYFDRLPGVIKNVGITWQKDYPWEIALDAPEGGSTSGLFVLPHVLDVNVTYQPVHDFLPQKGIHSPFIVPHKDSPISNKPGRKLWNSDPISADVITAEKERIAKAKAEKERKEQLEKDKEKAEEIMTKIKAIYGD